MPPNSVSFAVSSNWAELNIIKVNKTENKHLLVGGTAGFREVCGDEAQLPPSQIILGLQKPDKCGTLWDYWVKENTVARNLESHKV